MITLTMIDGVLTVEVTDASPLLLQHFEAALGAFRHTHNKNGNDGQTYRLCIKPSPEVGAEEVEA